MSIKDTNNEYGIISRWNHWILGLTVIGMLSIGFYFNDMPRGDEKFYWLRLHISVGGLIFIFLLFRVFWSWLTSSPQPFQQDKTLMILTRVVHGLLLLSVLVMAVSGPLLIWTRGVGINVFGYFSIPGPFTEKMPELHELMEEVHIITAKVLFVTLVIHVLGALKHRFIDKDDVMSRMVKFLRK